jgi:hypothetical protein
MASLRETFDQFRRAGIIWILAALLSVCVAVGQQQLSAPSPAPPAPTTPAPSQSNPAAKSSQDQKPGDAKAPSSSVPDGSVKVPDKQAKPDAPDHPVTDKEAKELFRSVDRILKFASKETKLPIREQVKRELVNRDQVEVYVNHRIAEDEDVQRMQRSEEVLKKFGLLPHSFDMRSFFVALLREQVAGYYDPKKKTVNLLNWVDPSVQEPVMAHELTHALQDQSFNLERWMKDGPTAEVKPASDPPDAKKADPKKKEDNSEEIRSDEQEAARLAVVEGQAMLVLVDYMLAPTDQSVLDSPGVVDAIKQGMMVGDNSPMFSRAPLYLKESLTFAYRYGLDFEREVLAKKGKEAAFAGVFKHPPASEREIMEPAAYLSDEHLPPLGLPDFEAVLGEKYQKFDIGSFGEFDVSVLLKQFGGADVSDRLTPTWRGGYYYAAKRKGEKKPPLAVVYVSRWASPEDALDFVHAYSGSVLKRYKHAEPVRIPERLIAQCCVPIGYTGVARNFAEDSKKPGEWMTEEGRVTVERHGELVLVMESFDRETADKLRDAVLAVNKPR